MAQKKPTTIATAYDIFMLDCESRRFTDTTLLFYRSKLTAFVQWCKEQNLIFLADVTANHIRAYFVHLQKQGLKDWTQNAAGRAIKTFFYRSVEEGLLIESPAKKVKLPRIDKAILPALTEDEIKRLLKACETERDRAIVMFLLDSGVRNAELVALNYGDIDMKSGAVTVKMGKGRKDRTVYIASKVRKQLLRYFAEAGTPAPDEPLWTSGHSPSEKRIRLSSSGLNQMFHRIRAKAGVKNATPHAMRRSFALSCLRGGMSVHVLAKLMGHSDTHTLRRYLDLTEDDLVSAHKKASPADNMKI